VRSLLTKELFPGGVQTGREPRQNTFFHYLYTLQAPKCGFRVGDSESEGAIRSRHKKHNTLETTKRDMLESKTHNTLEITKRNALEIPATERAKHGKTK